MRPFASTLMLSQRYIQSYGRHQPRFGNSDIENCAVSVIFVIAWLKDDLWRTHSLRDDFNHKGERCFRLDFQRHVWVFPPSVAVQYAGSYFQKAIQSIQNQLNYDATDHVMLLCTQYMIWSWYYTAVVHGLRPPRTIRDPHPFCGSARVLWHRLRVGLVWRN